MNIAKSSNGYLRANAKKEAFRFSLMASACRSHGETLATANLRVLLEADSGNFHLNGPIDEWEAFSARLVSAIASAKESKANIEQNK